MIPVKLQLRNFMCYKDVPEPLVLDGIHLACITGDNGHGKSAILDAITWVLWGKSRAKTADELIHIGQLEMEVEFEFTNGIDKYRVVRKRTRSMGHRSGNTILEIQVGDPSVPSKFRAITGNTVTETQEQIIKLLRMDYETFINSAFLRQGRADEFTLRTPKERKEVLAEILDLSMYDNLEALSKDQSKTLELNALALERRITEIDQGLVDKPLLKEKIHQVEKEVLRLESDESEQKTKIEQLASQRTHLEARISEMAPLKDRIKDIQGDLILTEKDVVRYKVRLQEYERLINDAETVSEGYQEYSTAIENKNVLEDKLSRYSHLVEDRNLIERTLASNKIAFTSKYEQLKAQATDLNTKSTKLEELSAALVQYRSKLDALDVSDLELKTRNKDQEVLSASIVELESNNRQLVIEMQNLREKIELFEEGTTNCPLCETKLGIDGIGKVQSAFEAEGLQKKQLFVNNQNLINCKKITKEKSRLEITEAQMNNSNNRGSILGGLSVLERDLHESESARTHLTPLLEEIGRLEKILSTNSFDTDESLKLIKITDAINALGYDPVFHKEISNKVVKLTHFQQDWQQLDEAQRHSAETKQDLEVVESRVSVLNTQLNSERLRADAIEKEATGLSDLDSQLGDARIILKRLSESLVLQRNQLATLQQSINALIEMETVVTGKRKELLLVKQDKGIYDELSNAFGKGGVQAMIIETVLPEIEDEANRLLSKMTDNRMHVKIETQRQRRSGGYLETLDINIADELGTRPYELFSGGEAFRINFALRIALSKLLSHRAGAPLPILFIDEGFGTQDGNGREKLLETLNMIKDDFDRIIVITHIEEMKEAFPDRIQVSKTEKGSYFSIN